MAIITIDNVEMPTPNAYSIPMDDLVSSDSARSESGVLLRNRVRQGICRLDLSWRVGDRDAMTLLEAITPSEVDVDYFDPRTGKTESAKMYVEGRSCALVHYTEGETSDDILWDISFSLVQY